MIRCCLACRLARLELDSAREEVVEAFRTADPDGTRAAAVFPATYDQLYDGQHTGRFRWDQLFKTEKTHFGTLLEINLRREFDDVIDDPSTVMRSTTRSVDTMLTASSLRASVAG